MAPPSKCSACRYRNKKYYEPNYFLAPYFPADEPQKFLSIHKVYGSAPIIRLLWSIPESQRAAAADSLSCDAVMRLRDPVHGCIGPLMQLLKKRRELHVQLASAKDELARLSRAYDSPPEKVEVVRILSSVSSR